MATKMVDLEENTTSSSLIGNCNQHPFDLAQKSSTSPPPSAASVSSPSPSPTTSTSPSSPSSSRSASASASASVTAPALSPPSQPPPSPTVLAEAAGSDFSSTSPILQVTTSSTSIGTATPSSTLTAQTSVNIPTPPLPLTPATGGTPGHHHPSCLVTNPQSFSAKVAPSQPAVPQYSFPPHVAKAHHGSAGGLSVFNRGAKAVKSSLSSAGSISRKATKKVSDKILRRYSVPSSSKALGKVKTSPNPLSPAISGPSLSPFSNSPILSQGNPKTANSNSESVAASTGSSTPGAASTFSNPTTPKSPPSTSPSIVHSPAETTVVSTKSSHSSSSGSSASEAPTVVPKMMPMKEHQESFDNASQDKEEFQTLLQKLHQHQQPSQPLGQQQQPGSQPGGHGLPYIHPSAGQLGSLHEVWPTQPPGNLSLTSPDFSKNMMSYSHLANSGTQFAGFQPGPPFTGNAAFLDDSSYPPEPPWDVSIPHHFPGDDSKTNTIPSAYYLEDGGPGSHAPIPVPPPIQSELAQKPSTSLHPLHPAEASDKSHSDGDKVDKTVQLLIPEENLEENSDDEVEEEEEDSDDALYLAQANAMFGYGSSFDLFTKPGEPGHLYLDYEPGTTESLEAIRNRVRILEGLTAQPSQFLPGCKVNSHEHLAPAPDDLMEALQANRICEGDIDIIRLSHHVFSLTCHGCDELIFSTASQVYDWLLIMTRQRVVASFVQCPNPKCLEARHAQCVGCSKIEKMDAAPQASEEGINVSWCCIQGRLVLLWAILWGFNALETGSEARLATQAKFSDQDIEKMLALLDEDEKKQFETAQMAHHQRTVPGSHNNLRHQQVKLEKIRLMKAGVRDMQRRKVRGSGSKDNGSGKKNGRKKRAWSSKWFMGSSPSSGSSPSAGSQDTSDAGPASKQGLSTPQPASSPPSTGSSAAVGKPSAGGNIPGLTPPDDPTVYKLYTDKGPHLADVAQEFPSAGTTDIVEFILAGETPSSEETYIQGFEFPGGVTSENWMGPAPSTLAILKDKILKKGSSVGKMPKGVGYGGPDASHGIRAGRFNMKKAMDKKDAQIGAHLDVATLLLPNTKPDDPFNKSPPEILASLISRSPLLDTVADLLASDSLVELGDRPVVYHSLIAFLRALSRHPNHWKFIFETLPRFPNLEGRLMEFSLVRSSELLPKAAEDVKNPRPSLLTLLHKLSVNAANFEEKAKKLKFDMEDGKPDPLVALCAEIRKIRSEMDRLHSLVTDEMDVDELASNAVAAPPVTDMPDKPKTTLELAKFFHKWHQEHCIAEVDDDDLAFCHSYANKNSGNPAPNRMKRIFTEITAMKTSLPEGIFVRYGSSRPDLMKILMVGSPGTPYENGLFEFDLLCVPQYPQQPPRMKFLSTGGGKYRLNPNLYNDGKICLSLLGTWEGQPWIPATSTILQILVSIQAMVLCEEPWYNEPGREHRKDHKSSKKYNESTQQGTMACAMRPWLEDCNPAREKIWGRVVSVIIAAKHEPMLNTLLKWRRDNTRREVDHIMELLNKKVAQSLDVKAGCPS
ncbi:putative ubiquitin conjugating enzyme family protein [Zalerion maritima]|uniref:Ubiquitin conjugating enzyme family protein n=1 Tax=Zalerion maritima TaxID=339359 RepID=A0AAD5RTG5_9PEZI|nr:putative ubiquitin conjugating enzyme family protein [Zalerion maritima]